jgi:RND family efflux transporter MFP subunit
MASPCVRRSSTLALLLLGVAGIGAALIVACGPADEEATEPTQRVVQVEVATALSRAVVDRVVASGTLAPRRQVDLSTEAAGRVAKLKVELGSKVRKGQLLALLDGGVARAQVRQAEANLRAAQARAGAATSKAGRTERLAAEGATSKSQLDGVRVEHESSLAAVEAAEAALALARDALRKTRITAPWAGTVAAVHLEVGSLLVPGQPTFRLVDIAGLKLRAGVTSKVVRQLEPGQAARIFLTDDPSPGTAGRVVHIGPEADARSHTYPIEVEVDNADGTLRAGMIARVEIAVGSRPEAVVIPLIALASGPDAHVFVVEGDTAARRSVTPGQRSGDDVEIRRGLQAGERVVTLGRQHLADGSKVRLYVLGEGSASESAED